MDLVALNFRIFGFCSIRPDRFKAAKANLT